MHVVDVTMFYAARSGGIRTYVEAKRAWLRSRGHRHTLVAPRVDGRTAGGGNIGLRSVPFPFSHGYRVPIGVRSAVKSIVGARPTIIEAGDAYHLAWSVLRARDALQVPAVAFCHSNVPRWFGMRSSRLERWAVRYCRALYSHFDLVLAPSPHVTAALRSWGVTRAQCQPLGVDVEQFTPARRNPLLRACLGLPPDTRLLVYAGRFAAEKNLRLLVDAVRTLDRRYVLLLVGAGTPPAALPGNVRVIDYVRDRCALAALLASCDAFVHAGNQETFGLSALEAMACGVPVVGLDAAGVGELIREGAGVAVRAGCAEAVAGGIEELFRADRAAIGLRCRRIAERFGWNQVLEELLQRYRSVCGGVRT